MYQHSAGRLGSKRFPGLFSSPPCLVAAPQPSHGYYVENERQESSPPHSPRDFALISLASTIQPVVCLLLAYENLVLALSNVLSDDSQFVQIGRTTRGENDKKRKARTEGRRVSG